MLKDSSMMLSATMGKREHQSYVLYFCTTTSFRDLSSGFCKCTLLGSNLASLLTSVCFPVSFPPSDWQWRHCPKSVLGLLCSVYTLCLHRFMHCSRFDFSSLCRRLPGFSLWSCPSAQLSAIHTFTWICHRHLKFHKYKDNGFLAPDLTEF